MANVFDSLISEGGGVARQIFIWGMLEELVNAIAEPVIRELAETANAKDPNEILSPQDLAQAVVRHVTEQATAVAEAAKSGLDADRFQTMLDLAAEPPGLETVLQMYRRGIVPWGETGPTKATVANAIATSRIYTYWSDAIRKLNVTPVPAAEMVDARVENQVGLGTRDAVESAANGGTVNGTQSASVTFYEALWASGFTPDQADLMFRVRGNPPSPGELFELFNRGLIQLTGTGQDALTVQQGIAEGATKDKWWPTLSGLIRDIPSLYYLKLMIATGTITPTLGAKLLTELGYTPTVVQGLVHQATSTGVTAQKQLTVSIIEKLYEDQIISRGTATTMLTDLGYTPTAATFILSTVDLARQSAAVDSAVTKIGTLYQARKLTATQAQSALSALDVVATAATALIATWSLERSATVRLLTASEIVDAWAYGMLSQTAAMERLEAIGYVPFDAWILLSNKNEAPLPDQPPEGPGTSGLIT